MSEVRIADKFDLSRFLDNPSFAHSVKLILKNGEGGEKKVVVVSGVVLAQFSQYFEELLSSGVRKVVVSSNPLLFAKDVQLKEFLRLLSGGTVEINKQNVYFLVKLAISYGIKQVLSVCYKWLKNHVDTSNALLLVELSLMSASLTFLRDQPALKSFYAHKFLSLEYSDFEIVLAILDTLSLDPLEVLKSEETEMSCIRTLLSQNEYRLAVAGTNLSNSMEEITLTFSNVLRDSATETNVETLVGMVKDQHEILLRLVSNDLENREEKTKEAPSSISSDEESDHVDDEVGEESDDDCNRDGGIPGGSSSHASKRRTIPHSSKTSPSKVRKLDSSDRVSMSTTVGTERCLAAMRKRNRRTKEMLPLTVLVRSSLRRESLLKPVVDESDTALTDLIQFKEFKNLLRRAEYNSQTGRLHFTENLLEYVEQSREANVQRFIIENYISDAKFKFLSQDKHKYLAILMRLAEKELSIKHLQMLVKAQNDMFLEIIKEQHTKQIVRRYAVRRARPRTSVNIRNCNLSEFLILPMIPGNADDVRARIKRHPIVKLSHDELLQLRRDNEEITEHVYIETCLFWIFHYTHPDHHYKNNKSREHKSIYVNLRDVKNEKVYAIIGSFNPFKVTYYFLSMLWKVYDIHKRFPECDFPEKDQWPVQLQSPSDNKVCPNAPVHHYGYAKSLTKCRYFISEVTDADRTMSVPLHSSILSVEYPCGEGCLYCQ